MKTFGAFEPKTHLSQYLTEVERENTSIMIQRRKKNIAVLRPAALEEESWRRTGAARILEALREVREEAAAYGESQNIRDLINEGRKH